MKRSICLALCLFLCISLLTGAFAAADRSPIQSGWYITDSTVVLYTAPDEEISVTADDISLPVQAMTAAEAEVPITYFCLVDLWSAYSNFGENSQRSQLFSALRALNDGLRDCDRLVLICCGRSFAITEPEADARSAAITELESNWDSLKNYNNELYKAVEKTLTLAVDAEQYPGIRCLVILSGGRDDLASAEDKEAVAAAIQQADVFVSAVGIVDPGSSDSVTAAEKLTVLVQSGAGGISETPAFKGKTMADAVSDLTAYMGSCNVLMVDTAAVSRAQDSAVLHVTVGKVSGSVAIPVSELPAASQTVTVPAAAPAEITETTVAQTEPETTIPAETVAAETEAAETAVETTAVVVETTPPVTEPSAAAVETTAPATETTAAVVETTAAVIETTAANTETTADRDPSQLPPEPADAKQPLSLPAMIILAAGGACLVILLIIIVAGRIRMRRELDRMTGSGGDMQAEKEDDLTADLQSYGTAHDTDLFAGPSSLAFSSAATDLEPSITDAGIPKEARRHTCKVLLRQSDTGKAVAEFFLATNSAQTLGRSSRANIILNDTDTGMSGVHFELHWDGRSLYIRDKNSTNGTTLGGNALKPQEWSRLTSDCEIGAGTYAYRLTYQEI